MALISFFSAKGAPGATSTAMLTAALWPRPTLLVDADPAGGDLLMRLPTASGMALTPRPGLLTLLPLARHGLAPGVVLDHSQVVQGGQQVLVGLDTPEQADASAALWPTLARTFGELPGTDVVIDLGQLSVRSGQMPLAERSDILVGVIRLTPASVMHMRQRLTALTRTLATLGPDAPLVGLIAIADVQQQVEASSALATVLTEVPDVHHLGMVAHDPRAERMFHGDPLARPERTMLVRSGRSLVQRIQTLLAGTVPEDAGPNAAANSPETTTTADRPSGASEDTQPTQATAATGEQNADAAAQEGAEPEVQESAEHDAAAEPTSRRDLKKRKWRILR